MRREIMALRKDPTANAVMAGAFANSNAKVLNDRLGRKPTDGELYMAHFLGASGAARFIKRGRSAARREGGEFVSRAPRSRNSSIFYDRQGGARSLKQVYAGLVAKHDVIGTTRVAAVKPVEPREAGPSCRGRQRRPVAATRAARRFSPRHSGGARATRPRLRRFGTAAVTAITAATASRAGAARPRCRWSAERSAVARPPAALFESLYQRARTWPGRPVVRELWGAAA